MYSCRVYPHSKVGPPCPGRRGAVMFRVQGLGFMSWVTNLSKHTPGFGPKKGKSWAGSIQSFFSGAHVESPSPEAP